MRINQPVSQRERTFAPRAQLISTTDRNGTITSANDGFVDISGFSREELIGSPHNLVRHPDMPPEAFADMWRTLKQSKAWMGLVKNRCQSGDHYYVDAYVTPIFENDQVIGYQSVRVTPDRDIVARAEQRYAELRKQKVPFWRKFSSTHLPLRAKLFLLSGWAALPALVMQQWWVALASFILVGTFGGWMVHPILALANKAREVFSNPLTQDIYTGRGDEIGEVDIALRVLQAEARTILGRISEGTNQIAKVVEHSREIVRQTTHSVENQQSELYQVATAMNEMSATVHEVASSAERTANQSRDVMDKTSNGEHLVNQAMHDIESLSQAIAQAKEVIERLMRESESIGSVVDVISSIASETNLLALNAAIEAARAGEQGRGFAVVADEVRSLAQRTQESTAEIQQMIQRLQNGAQEAVRTMADSSEEMERTVSQAARAGESLAIISSAVAIISDMNSQIAQATDEQKSVSQEISRNVVNISDVAKRSELSVEEVERASNELTKLASQLGALVSGFTTR